MIDSKRPTGDTSFTSNDNDATSESGAERIQKLIAQAGLASRRDAEDLIREGQVTVNGKTASLGDKATLGVDAIKVKGKLIHYAANKVYYMIYKPKNFIAMIAEDEEGRPTLKDLISKQIKERLFPVGRMDYKGEGAIILTNDGDMAQKILKSNDIIRRYHVKVDRHPSQEDLARLARGGRIDGRSMQPYHVRVAEGYNRNALIEISFEGMGAVDVKKFFENKGFFPEKVARVGIGHISAENLSPGDFKKLNPSSVEALFLQPELAKKGIERLIEKRASGVKVVDKESIDEAPKAKIASAAIGAAGARRNEKKTRNPRGRAVRGLLNDGSARAERALNRPTRPTTSARPARDEDRAPRVSPHPFGDRPRKPRPDSDRALRSGGSERSERFARADSGRPSSPRSFGGDRPARAGADRAAAPRGNRSSFGERSFGDKRAAGGENKTRSFGDRAARPGSSARPARGGSDRPTRSFGAKKPAGGSARFKR